MRKVFGELKTLIHLMASRKQQIVNAHIVERERSYLVIILFSHECVPQTHQSVLEISRSTVIF